MCVSSPSDMSCVNAFGPMTELMTYILEWFAPRLTWSVLPHLSNHILDIICSIRSSASSSGDVIQTKCHFKYQDPPPPSRCASYTKFNLTLQCHSSYPPPHTTTTTVTPPQHPLTNLCKHSSKLLKMEDSGF